MPVEDPGYFYDGYGIVGEVGDTVQLSGQTETARVIRIDYKNKRLVLDKALIWLARQGVTLRYAGKGPDLGAFEFGLAQDAAAPLPQRLRPAMDDR
jgi:hypothetical protein